MASTTVGLGEGLAFDVAVGEAVGEEVGVLVVTISVGSGVADPGVAHADSVSTPAMTISGSATRARRRGDGTAASVA